MTLDEQIKQNLAAIAHYKLLHGFSDSEAAAFLELGPDDSQLELILMADEK